jgi:hypothetical protein
VSRVDPQLRDGRADHPRANDADTHDDLQRFENVNVQSNLAWGAIGPFPDSLTGSVETCAGAVTNPHPETLGQVKPA